MDGKSTVSVTTVSVKVTVSDKSECEQQEKINHWNVYPHRGKTSPQKSCVNTAEITELSPSVQCEF